MRDKGTLIGMNPPQEITPEYAERLVTLCTMISECDLDGNGNLFGAPRQQGRRLLPANAAIMSSSILGYGSAVYPVNTQMSPPNREAPDRNDTWLCECAPSRPAAALRPPRSCRSWRSY